MTDILEAISEENDTEEIEEKDPSTIIVYVDGNHFNNKFTSIRQRLM